MIMGDFELRIIHDPASKIMHDLELRIIHDLRRSCTFPEYNPEL